MKNNISEKDKKAYSFILNNIINYGKSPSLREINEVTGGKSPRSASLILDRLIENGLIKKSGRDIILINTQADNSINTVDVPLVGSIACGAPIFAEENIETYIPISTALAKKGSTYFLLRAIGDSMDLVGINSGDLLLIRQQQTADDGDRVVALINDKATVKVLERSNGVVILRPRSKSNKHKPIILTESCIIQGVVAAVLPADIY